MVADVLSKSSRAEAERLVETFLQHVDPHIVHSCKKVLEAQHQDFASNPNASGGKRELDLDTTMALFFELDLSWSQYHQLTHVWRISTESTDKRLPSKRAVYERYMESKTAALQVEVPLGPGQGSGSVCVRTPEAALQAVIERVQGVADDSASSKDGVFERFVQEQRPVELTLATDGFSVPDFNQKAVNYIQGNVRVGVPGARALGYLSSHIPLMLGRCPETYEAYQTVWPLVEAPFLKDGRAISTLPITWKGAQIDVPVVFYMSNDLKSTLMLLGHQGSRGKRPCPCCSTDRKSFGSEEELFRPEHSLRRMSSLHYEVIQSFHQPEVSLGGRTVMSLISEEQQALEDSDCEGLAGALLANDRLGSFLRDAAEIKGLQEDGAIGSRSAAIEKIIPGEPLPCGLEEKCTVEECARIRDYVSRWDGMRVLAGGDSEVAEEQQQLLQFMASKGLSVEEERHESVWWWCKRSPCVEDMCGNKTRAANFLRGVAMNFTRPSLSQLVVEPESQVVMETLHCVLNLVRSHFESLKLMCNRFFKRVEVVVDGKIELVPVLKSPDELAAWNQKVRQDNSALRSMWRANGCVLEDDLETLLGFREPMMGYHGNQCFSVLSKWEEICNIPVLKALDVFLSGHTSVPVPEEHSRLRQWLSGLHATCEEIRRTRPCVARLERSIRGWFSVVSMLQGHEAKLYTCKTYDHFCCVHLVPMILRLGNVVQYATFGTEHDNSIIRRDVRAHTTSGGGKYGGDNKASDLMQLFERRCVMRSDRIIRNSTKSSEWKVLAEGGVCECVECLRRFGLGLDSLPQPPEPDELF